MSNPADQQAAAALGRLRSIFSHDSRGVWFPVVREIIRALGGSADLEQIYSSIQTMRPTANPHWRAKVRQVLQRHASAFERTAPGQYQLREAVAA